MLLALSGGAALDRATWQSGPAARVRLHDDLRASEPHGQYFKEQVRRELVDRFGWQRVYQGGLRVFSTIDMPMQIAAEAAVNESLKMVEEKRGAWLERRRRNARNAAAAADDSPLQAALI